MNSVLNKINRKLLVNTIFNNSLCIRATSTRLQKCVHIFIYYNTTNCKSYQKLFKKYMINILGFYKCYKLYKLY